MNKVNYLFDLYTHIWKLRFDTNCKSKEKDTGSHSYKVRSLATGKHKV